MAELPKEYAQDRHPMLSVLVTDPVNYPPGFERMFAEWLVTDVADQADISRFHMAEAFVKIVDEKRKIMNQRLLALKKAFTARRSELVEKILDVLRAEGHEGKRVDTPIGTVALIDKGGERYAEIEDEAACLRWMLEEQTVSGKCFETVTRLSPTGKEEAKDLALKGTEIPGVNVKQRADSVTCRRSRAVSQERIEELVHQSIFEADPPIEMMKSIESLSQFQLPEPGDEEEDCETLWGSL